MFLSKIIDALFPIHCVGCESSGSYVCKRCHKQGIRAHSEICPSCHTASPDFKICIACRSEQAPYPLDGICISLQYTDITKTCIQALKYQHVYHIAGYMARKISLSLLAHPTLSKQLEAGSLIISDIPSHWIRHYRIKGYNQSTLLAKHIAKHLGCSYISLGKRGRYTISQVSLGRSKRKTNLKNAFSAYQHIALPCKRYLVLIDDVTTTGATLQEYASCIKKQHPHLSIWGAVFARHGI